MLDTDEVAELGELGDEVLEDLTVVLAVDAAVTSHLGVVVQRVGVRILREGSHLDRSLGGVVTHDAGQDDGVCEAVGQMVESAELVGHGVVEAQEGVTECHTGHAGCVVHLLASVRILGTVGEGAREVLEDELCGALGEALGVIGSHDGDIGLDGVGHDVNTGSCGEALRGGHAVVSVDDSHVGEQRVVGERPLDAGLLVGDDGERRALGASARGGRDGDEISLLAHLGEGEDTLADVHEVHGHVLEVRLGVLVHHPHDLAGVHCGTAADGDDDIRFEERHLLGAATCALQGGIGLNVVEAVVSDAHLIELGLDGTRVAILEEELVGNDEGALLAHYVAELVECDGRAALLEVDLLGCAEPQHVLAALCHGLDVNQVLHPNVLGDGVATPGAAAQG